MEPAPAPLLRKEERVRTSRALSSVLRHRATELGLAILPGGYVRVDELLALPRFRRVTREQLREVVAMDDKERYHLVTSDAGDLLIRANQGHSMAVVEDEGLLELVAHPDELSECVHGTYRAAWDSIRVSGLSRMRRNHVHFATSADASRVKSGMRRDVEVLIYIDVPRAMTAGIQFFRSRNGVVLSAGVEGRIPPEYFQRVVDRVSGVTLLPAPSPSEAGRAPAS